MSARSLDLPPPAGATLFSRTPHKVSQKPPMRYSMARFAVSSQALVASA